jgi:hypothetical protein
MQSHATSSARLFTCHEQGRRALSSNPTLSSVPLVAVVVVVGPFACATRGPTATTNTHFTHVPKASSVAIEAEEGGSSTSREEKLKNLIVNHSMIVMAMFEELFFEVAERMTAVPPGKGGEPPARSEDPRAVATAEGRGGGGEEEEEEEEAADAMEHSRSNATRGKRVPVPMIQPGMATDVQIQIEYLFSEIREEAASELPKKSEDFARYVASPIFDEGIAIVDSYSFVGRPRFTEKLTDDVLASYVFLLQSGDKKLESMVRELSEWRRRLPKPNWGE